MSAEDLSGMSDEDLLKQLSDEDLLAMAGSVEAPEKPAAEGFDPKRPVLSAMSAVAGAIDPYTGAPVRSAIGAGMRRENPIEAYRQQFGKPSETAPTGRELSEQAGVSPSVSPYTGVAVDVLADPTMLIPGKLVGKTATAVKGMAKSALPRIGHALSGIPAKEISTFAKDYKKVSEMISKYKDAPDVAADMVREGYQAKLQAFKRGANNELSTALSSGDASKRIPVAPLVEELSKQQARINPKLYPGDHGAMADLQKTVLDMSTDGTVSASEMHELKQFFDDIAKPEWTATGQRIFTKGDKVARAAKQTANIARKEVNTAVPAAKQANQKLSALRQIEDKMNKNLIAPGKPEGALTSAGSGGNIRARAQLERLGKVTGQDFLSEAESLAAFNRFRDIPLLPVDPTGKSLLRSGGGAALGYSIGGWPGAAVGAMSPAAIRYGIPAYKRGVEPILNALPSAESLYRPTMTARGLGVEERKKRLKALEGK